MNHRSMSGLVVATSSGAQMHSARPQPIHLLCGRAMASYVLDTLSAVGVRQGVVVTGAEGTRISKRLLEDPPGFPVRFVEQKLDRGTGDAVLAGLSGFDDFNDDEDLLIIPSDLPLLQPDMLRRLIEGHASDGNACTMLSVAVGDELGFNRIVRDRHGRVAKVRGDRELMAERAATQEGRPLVRPADLTRRARAAIDASEEDTLPSEAATGVFSVRRGLLAPAIRRTMADNSGRGLQLFDIVEVLTESGHRCGSVQVDSAHDLTPVGTRLQLAEAEAELRRRTNRHWLSMGVTMVDPDRTYIDATVTLGTDVTIFPGTILQGSTVIGDGCELGPDVRLDRCDVGRNTRVEKATATLATIGSDCTVGPFAVLAPGSSLGSGMSTGPFYAGA